MIKFVTEDDYGINRSMFYKLESVVVYAKFLSNLPNDLMIRNHRASTTIKIITNQNFTLLSSQYRLIHKLIEVNTN